MKGDFSRLSFDPTRNVRTVTVQQGRVLTDADMNEASEAMLRRIETAARDVLGPVAASVGTDGFKILAAGGGKPDRLSAGRLYVDGLQLENHAELPLPAIPGDGRRLVCVRATVDHVTGVEEPRLRDAALGDADTAGRAVVRNEILVLEAKDDDACGSPNALYEAMAAPSGGRMTVTLATAGASSDPCKLTPDSGYARLENLLYRCEIHDGTPAMAGLADRFDIAALKVKVSRNNACELSRIKAIDSRRITLAAASKDGLPVFRSGEYVEFLAAGAPFDAASFGPLTRIEKVEDDILTVTDATGATVGGRIRLWSQDVVTLGADNRISIDGLDMTFSGSDFRRGDFWVTPGRYALHDVDPTVRKGVPLPPAGPQVVHARLGMLTVNAGVIDPNSLLDCRPLFVPLSESVELDYAGGDGQSIRPPTGPAAAAMAPLPSKLRAVVRIGHQPVAGAVVTFAIARPSPASGSLSGAGASGAVTGAVIEVVSDAAGVAEAEWTLDPSPTEPVQRVTATLVTTVNPAQKAPPALEYTAELDLASGIAYEPGGCAGLAAQTTVQGALDKLCTDLGNLTASQIGYEEGKCSGLNGMTNVQDALDKLCRDILNTRRQRFMIVTEVILPALGGPIDNNQVIEPKHLMEGFIVRFSEELSTQLRDVIDEDDPIARLTLDLPVPLNPSAQREWARFFTGNAQRVFVFGTSPVHLTGKLSLEPGSLRWFPSDTAQRFLATFSDHQFGLGPGTIFNERFIKGWITLRGDSLWSGDGKERLYLNGEMLRFPADDNMFSIFGSEARRLSVEELVENTDPQRSAPFELWFKMEIARRG